MSFSIQPWRIKDWFSFLSDKQLEQFQTYATELLNANKTSNLIPSKSISALDLVHFADSILASQLIYQKNPGLKSIYDIGSGPGFPGVVFGIMYPEVRVNLVESDGKKADFLRSQIALMGLSNVLCLQRSIETLPDDSIEYAVSRNYAQLTKSLISTRKCFKKGGVYFHMKGDEWSMEVSQIPTQLCSQWEVALFGDYKLPFTEFKISVVKTTRIN
ncbi:MAG: 16S rRNA (guanine(527)-N(7))-methyltransferase RsmG [Pseudobdellovibrionaceae bacterium]